MLLTHFVFFSLPINVAPKSHSFVDVRTLWAFAPLHIAACLGVADVARVLIRYGANLSVRCTGVMSFSTNVGSNPPWEAFATPLHIAVANHFYPLVLLLLEALVRQAAINMPVGREWVYICKNHSGRTCFPRVTHSDIHRLHTSAGVGPSCVITGYPRTTRLHWQPAA